MHMNEDTYMSFYFSLNDLNVNENIDLFDSLISECPIQNDMVEK